MNTATGAKTGGAANRGQSPIVQHVMGLLLKRREKKVQK